MDSAPISKTTADRRRPSKRSLIATAAVLALAAAAFVAVYFQPQKLFIDDTVNEAAPTVVVNASSASADSVAPAPALEPVPTMFSSRAHTTTGSVRIVNSGNRSFVRIEGLSTDNGPDLRVYLSAVGIDGTDDTFDDSVVDLGKLKGNIGDQNYELPPGTDLSAYRSLVIWCNRFNVSFGVAAIPTI